MTSTAPATPARMTKPRLSLLIVESAFTAVAAVLLAWLLLWFIWQRSRELRLEAYRVAPSTVSMALHAPFQAADVRSLSGNEPTNIAADGLSETLKTVISRPGAAVVVYVSAPAIGKGPDAVIGSTSLRSLIETVVNEARRDVVLALDVAQIDSDRDLGVYGNSPYEGLEELVNGLKPGDRRIAILTSGAPAQKSWGADGLGQSAFAYFLGEGLSGKAQGWDAPGLVGQVSVDGLHRYVSRHVTSWARSHRNAVQTPMLLKIGGGSRGITLPYRKAVEEKPFDAAGDEIAVASNPSATPEARPASTEKSATTKDGAAAEKAKEADKPDPVKAAPISPRDQALVDLVSEWKQHDALRSKRPYHELPEAWRLYQTGLVRAERRLRAAWRGAGSIDAVRQVIAEARQSREALESRLKAVWDLEKAFPLRPARSEEAGKQAITEALVYLTGTGPEEADLFHAAPPTPKPAADGPKEEAKLKKAEPPRVLLDAQFTGYPETYLELQSAAWALSFTDAFNVADHFKKDPRGAILRRLVQVRARAEDALAVDRRGLAWIRPILELGDEQRRKAQDELFDPDLTAEDRARRLSDAISQFDRIAYAPARDVAQGFHDGRSAWERAAAELPELAEWAVRAEQGARTTQSLSSQPLPPAVDRALNAAKALADVLDRPLPKAEGADFVEQIRKPLDDLRAATHNTQIAVDELEKQLLAKARGDAPRNWIAMDAALRTPLIPSENRERMLKVVLEMREGLELKADPGTIGVDAYTPDPGFWGLAAGLAQLDRRLRLIGRGDRPEAEGPSQSLVDLWSLVQSAPEARESVDAGTALLGQYAAAAREERKLNRVARAERQREKERKPEHLGRSLRDDDRAVRLLCNDEIEREDPPIDLAPQNWQAFAKYDVLRFQIERLRRDYLRANADAELRRVAVEIARTLGIAEAPEHSGGSPTLRIETTPHANSSLSIGENGKAEMKVAVAPPDEGIMKADPIPPGRAFLGIVTKKSGLRIVAPDGAGTSSPAGVLQEVGPSAPVGRPVRFTVSQEDLASNTTTFEAQAQIFYRGRVDEGGVAVVHVIPREFKNLVMVTISQDPQDLVARFGEGAPARIKDQFAEHPGAGYMHLQKDAAYVLTLNNPTFKPLTVSYKRTLVDPANQVPPKSIDPTEVSHVLPPGESVLIPGKVTSAETPKGQVRDLRVSLRVAENEAKIPDFVVRFRQIELKEYMTIVPFTDLLKVDGSVSMRHAVRFMRHADDPVTEPIGSDEISCTINDIVGRYKKGGSELLRGGTVTASQPADPGKQEFDWSGKVENELVNPKQPAGAKPAP